MTITIHWCAHKPDTMENDWSKRTVKSITGKTATECMEVIRFIKYHHDGWLYSPVEIINVED